MTPPLVSIVMPLLMPHPLYFREAIESVVNQSFTDFELIVVEDPSAATGQAFLARFNDARIKYILNSERTSLVRQHNRALSETRGRFICRFDADDICEPQRLERELTFLQSHPGVDIVGSCVTVIDEHGAVIGARQYPLEHNAILAAMRRYNPIANSTVMYRREVYERFGGKRDSPLPAQDYEWYSRVATGGARFANLAEPLVRYRVHAQMSRQKLRGTLRTTLEVKNMYWRAGMDLPSRAFMIVERALLFLPAWLVRRMFVAIRYRRPGFTWLTAISRQLR
jgi:glycosyltransferase involved in cell wall biosynthesis